MPLRRALLIAALALAAYGGSLANGLVLDDVMFHEDDPRVASISTVPRLFLEARWAFSGGGKGEHRYYRPMEALPYAFSHFLFGGAVRACHVPSLLLHVTNVVLLFVLLLRLTGDAGASTLGAALLAVHPAGSEAVIWAASIGEPAILACTLLALLLWRSPRRAAPAFAILHGTLFLTALFFKETGILLPAFVLLHDLVLGEGRPRAARYAAFLPPLALYLPLRLHALGSLLPGADTGSRGVVALTANALALLPRYARLLVWPAGLHFWRDYDPVAPGAPVVWLGAALLLLLAVVAVSARRAEPLVTFGFGWILLALSPHLVPYAPGAPVMADRYLYLPLAGVALAVAPFVRRLHPLPRPALAAAAALALVCIGADEARARDFRDEETLFRKTLAGGGRAEPVRVTFSYRLLKARRFDEGIAILRPLVDRDPSWHAAWQNLGLLYLGKKDRVAATAAFEEAVRTDPRDPRSWLNLGFLRGASGRIDEAAACYLRVVKLAPRDADAWWNLATLAAERGQAGNVRLAASRLIGISLQNRSARELLSRLPPGPPRPDAETARRCEAARRLLQSGRREDAVLALQAAAWLDEASPLPHQYLANAAYLAGRPGEALAEEREALRLEPGNAVSRRNVEALERARAAGEAPR